MRATKALLCGWLFVTGSAMAQSAIRYDAAQHVWQITAGEMSYVLGVNDKQALQTIYWGQKIDAASSFPQPRELPEVASFDPPIATTPIEYTGWGGGLPYEPTLKVSFPDGNRSLQLVYVDGKVAGDELEITVKDALAPIFVHLFYHAYPEGIVARWSRIENRGPKTVTIEQASSATWNLPARSTYDLSTLTGRWGGEWQLQTEALHPGAVVLESRRGSTSQQANPWFSIGSHGETTETSGPVWFGELGWSGSWRINVEQIHSHAVRITGGYNPFDFAWPLAAGQSLETPKFYAGYTGGGNGEASRILHRFQRGAGPPPATHTQTSPGHLQLLGSNRVQRR